MVKLMTKFSVKDFDAWQKVFNESMEMRAKAGAKGAQAFRGAEDMNAVTVIIDWDDPEKAKAFSQSADLREAQQRAGVNSKVEAYLLQSV